MERSEIATYRVTVRSKFGLLHTLEVEAYSVFDAQQAAASLRPDHRIVEIHQLSG